MIDKFFKKCPEKNIKKMVEIINGESEISLRILDWFITRYSKKKLDITVSNGEIFNVHISYKAQLKSYKKIYFDPFRRRQKFYYSYYINGEEKKLLTTLGQLNFFKWAIKNKIVKMVVERFDEITKEMNKSNKEDKIKKEEKKLLDEEKKKNIKKKKDGKDKDSFGLNKNRETIIRF